MKKLSNTQVGISLLELIVSLAIGIILLLSLASVYVTANQANKIRSTDELMDETARQVFDRLQQDLNVAGYVDIFDEISAGGNLIATEVAKPSLATVQDMYGRLMPTPAPGGAAAAVPKTPIEIASGTLNLKAAIGTDTSLTIAYQAASTSTANHVSIPQEGSSSGADSGMITNCIGAETLQANKWVVNNYTYVSADKAFKCQNQPIVDGIEEMTLRYLITDPTTTAKANMYNSPSGLYVARIVNAAGVNASALQWSGVTGIEVCMVVAGEPITGRLATVASLQENVPTCERESTPAATFKADKARPANDDRLYRRYIKVLTIPNALYYTE